jgi:hypothetical protein
MANHKHRTELNQQIDKKVVGALARSSQPLRERETKEREKQGERTRREE